MSDTYKPTEAMASAARRALEIRDKQPDSNKGMTQVGLTRARQLIAREPLSLDTVKRMHSFFSRHEVDKKGEGWGKDSKGYQAWLGWGGDAGQSWAKSIVESAAKAANQSVLEFIGNLSEGEQMHTNKLIEREGRWYVYDSSGQKNIGKKDGYADKEGALKQLRAIEAAKAQNKVLLQVNIKKSMIRDQDGFFYIEQIPITVNDAVMNRVLYPRDENRKGMASMRNKPLTIGHPVDDSGNFTTGREGEGLQRHYSGGIITNTYEIANTWYADAKIEKSVLEVKSPELYQALANKEDMPVSTGLLFTQNEQSGVNQKGDEYDKVAINMQFDHLAALLDETPAGGDDTVARFNSQEIPVFYVNELMIEPIPDEVKQEVEGLLSKASNAVKSFFRPLLNNDQKNGYNDGDTDINVNEAEIMQRQQALEIIGLPADSDISDATLNTLVTNMAKAGMKKNKSMKDVMNMPKDEAMKMMKNMSPEDMYSFFKNGMDEMEQMKKNGDYKANQSDNPELLDAINSLKSEIAEIKGDKNASTIEALAANSACVFDKADLEAMPESAINKLAAEHLGSVRFNASGGFESGANSNHELDSMEAPE